MPQTLGSLANKAKIKFGSLYGAPIIWIKADKNHAGYPANSVTLVTNQIIKLLCFDAEEPANGNSDRRNYGNNRYIWSNLRQWLNSDAAAGQWYTAQHSADQAPDSSHVWSGYNPYNTIAGFLNGFTANERAALLATTITVGKSSTDGGGTETCVDKVFPLSCTEVNLPGDHVCGSKLAIFSDNSSRIATVSASAAANSNYDVDANQAWYTGCGTPMPGRPSTPASSVPAARCSGTAPSTATTACAPLVICPLISWSPTPPTRTAATQSSTTSRPRARHPYTVPSEVIGGENLSISWGQSTDPTATSPATSWSARWTTAHGRRFTAVAPGATPTPSPTDGRACSTASRHTTRPGRERLHHQRRAHRHQQPAARHQRQRHRPRQLHDYAASYEYTVTDADGHQVTVVEKLDTTTLRTYTATLGDTNELEITADQWLKLLNGDHTLTITATDAKNESTVRTLSFDKAMHSVEFEQTVAMAADDMPTKALVNIQGSFPTGSTLQVWICNNGNDAEPTWEDITTKALTSQKHFFTNQTKTAENWGVKIKVKLLRGSAVGDCYIQSVGGNFA